MRTFWLAAVTVMCWACGDETNIVNNPAAAGPGGGPAGVGGSGATGGESDGGSGGDQGGASASSAGGAGGSAGGAGGQGGGPCVPLECANVHGACGDVGDGCGGTLDCEAECTYEGVHMGCGQEGLCECNGAPNPESAAVCASGEAADYCDAMGGCMPLKCGPSPNTDAPTGCKWFGPDLTGDDVWCCPP